MKIKEITSQHRRDFHAIVVCEGCNHEQTISGYDDRNYHDNVVPNIKCKKCGETTLSLGKVVEKVETKYEEGYQI